MSTSIQTLPLSPGRLWTARLLSGLVILFLLFDGITKVFKESHVIEAFNRLGLPANLAPQIGILVLVCAIVYAIPRSAILGAVLITGLLGGAVATHVRAGSPAFEAFVFPAIMGALTWIPLWLRDVRVRALL
ncbi:MAG TPA: DoxX family protein [Steroidobacteraceae bacterium]|nr:DoxX family protein [Steroidobacteraceae bacterium]